MIRNSFNIDSDLSSASDDSSQRQNKNICGPKISRKLHKRIALAIVAISNSNVVTTQAYQILLGIDSVFHLYLAVMILLKEQHPNLLQQLNFIELLLNPSNNIISQVSIQGAILFMLLSIFSIMAFIIIVTPSLDSLKGYSSIKSLASSIFALFLTVLQIPIFEIAIGTFFIKFDSEKNADFQVKGVLHSLSIINVFFATLLTYCLKKIYTARLPEKLPWASSNSQFHVMMIVNRIVLVACHLYFTTGPNTDLMLSTIPPLILFFSTAVSRNLFIPHYTLTIEWLHRLTDSCTAALLLFSVAGHYLINQRSHQDLDQSDQAMSSLIVTVGIPCLIIMQVDIDRKRKSAIWRKINNMASLIGGGRNNSQSESSDILKGELEIEHGLYLLYERLETASDKDYQGNAAYADIVSLIEIHKETCQNRQCPCQNLAAVELLLNMGRNKDKKILVLEQKDIAEIDCIQTIDFLNQRSHLIDQSSSLLTQMQISDGLNFYQSSSQHMDDQKLGNETPSTTSHKTQQWPSLALNPQQIFIVNLEQMKRDFLNRYLKLFYEEALRRQPNSSIVLLQCLLFALRSYKSRYLAETLIREHGYHSKSSDSSMGWFERIAIIATEIQTIMEIKNMPINSCTQIVANKDSSTVYRGEQNSSGVTVVTRDQFNSPHGYVHIDGKDSQKNFIGIDKDGIDPEQFITKSKLGDEFYEKAESLASHVHRFWKLVNADNFNVFQTQKQGLHLADAIAQTVEVFHKIEQYNSRSTFTNIKNSSNIVDLKIIYSFALLQKYLLNDVGQFNLYIGKMNSQYEVQRLLKNNGSQSQQQTQLEESRGPGFILVRGSKAEFGQIIQSNEVIRKELGYTSQDLKHKTIHDLMPSLICQWHQGFVDEFIKTDCSTSRILNKTNCMFLKQQNGYIKPALLHIVFHFSHMHGFTFFSQVTFMTDIQLQKGKGKHHIDDIMFLICEDVDNNVHDISDTCQKHLGLSAEYLNQSRPGFDLPAITIQDICPNLYISPQRASSKSLSFGNNDPQERITEVNLRAFKNMNHGYESYQLQPNSHQAICLVYREEYGVNTKRTMNIVALVLLDQLAISKIKHITLNLKEQNKENNHLVKNELSQDSIEHSQEQQSICSSESSMVSQNHIELKQLYSSTEKVDSKSLKLVTQLLMFVFILLLVVSTLNLVLTVQQFANLDTDIMHVRKSYDRIQLMAKIRLYLRVLSTTANGYGPPKYEDSLLRFTTARGQLEQSLLQLKEIQEYFDHLKIDDSEKYEELRSRKDVQLEYLDPYNVPQLENQTYSYGMNLFLQRFFTVCQWPMPRFNGSLALQKIENPSSTFQPNEAERQIYFLFKTATGTLRLEGKIVANFFRDDTISAAMDISEKTLITIIVSIISIILVSLLVSPIICRIEERKYLGLKFFLKVDQTNNQSLEAKVDEFMKQVFSDTSVHRLNRIINEIPSNENDEKESINEVSSQSGISNSSNQLAGSSSFNIVSSIFKKSNRDVQVKKNFTETNKVLLLNTLSNRSRQNDSSDAEFIQRVGQRSGRYLQKVAIQPPSISDFNRPSFASVQNKNNLVVKIQQSSSFSQKKSLKSLKMRGANRLQYEGTVAMNPASNDIIERTESEQSNNSNERDSQKAQKVLRINNVIQQQKIKTIIMLGLLAIIFSSYFVVAYFFSVQPFQMTPEILKYLELIFTKDSNIENAISFIRDELILNETIPALEDITISGTDYFLNQAAESEMEYMKMRRSVPEFFDEVKSLIERVETNELCRIAYQDDPDYVKKVPACEATYNGILLHGLTYSMNVIIRHFQKEKMKWDSEPRTTEFILTAMKLSTTHALADMKHGAIDSILNVMKNRITLAISNYYQQLVSQYQKLFSTFVVIMCVLFTSFMLFGYGRIKDAIWKTNLNLKIMPLELIPKTSLHELKAFYQF